MNYEQKTKQQLIAEMEKLAQQVTELEQSETTRKQIEKELRESRAQHQSLMESISNFAVYRLAPDLAGPLLLNLVFISPSVKDILGLSDPLRFEALFEIMDPNDVERVLAANLKAFETSRFDESFRIFHPKKREWRWIHAVSTGVRDENGQVRFINGILIDITDQKKAEEVLRRSHDDLEQIIKERTLELHKSEERFQFVARASNDAIYDWDILSGEAWLSAAHQTLFGYQEERAGFEWWKEKIHPEDRQKTVSSINAVMEKGGNFWSCEYRFRRADGSFANILDRGSVVRDEAGKPIRLVGSMMEITALQEALEARLKSEELFRHAFENANTGMCLVSLEGRLLKVNDQMSKIFGYAREELERMTVNDLAHPEDRHISPEFIQRSIAGEIERTVFEKRYYHKQGHIVYGQVSSSIIRHPLGKEPQFFISSVQDITGRKKAEEERLIRSKLESTGILAGGIAHDFNNLLSVILGNLELAQMAGQAGELMSDFLTEAEKAVLKARDLTHQLIIFSKGGDPVRAVFSLADLLKERTARALKGSQTKQTLFIPADLWSVEGDQGQIGQCIQNMVMNAREAMAEGGTVSIRAENNEGNPSSGFPLPDGNLVKITISDQGGGIPEEILPQIFDPYFSTKQRGELKGMGLGLTICHSIIKKHEGTITVDSKLGEGTTFTIYLPAAWQGKPAEPVETDFFLAKGRILVMDDEAMIRNLYQSILARLGYEVELTDNGEKAVALFRKARELSRPFAGVILDLTVRAGMGGKEAIKQMKAIDPLVKAVISSGYEDDPVIQQYAQYGFQASLIKPFKIQEVRAVLNRVIGRVDQKTEAMS